ncbi:MAG: nucleoside phosphorylase [Candidatus Thorarchaeota archaeon SMTZ1-83]|nr:MAG: uridine phosphorylase [Candidatus Thorarchaeota archaeon SMTZ1-83]
MPRETVSARRPETPDRKQYHIEVMKGDVADSVLLPGDPQRVAKISAGWDSFSEVASHRQYVTHTGIYKGVPISACSTGIGGPGTAIAIEELANVGVRNLIRVGSCATLKEHIEIGDLIISTGGVRLEGTSKQYVRPEYPAAASYEIIMALVEAADTLGFKYHLGISASTDSFYLGQSRPGFNDYTQSFSETLVKDLTKANVANFEMEAATLFTLANIYGFRSGAVCAVYANRVKDEFAVKGEESVIACGNEAVKILAEMDKEKTAAKKEFWMRGL